MQPQRFSTQSAPRSPVFRLRPSPLRPPFGQWAYLAHGDASLPDLSVRSGDLLCVSADLAGGPVQVLEPQSPGHPMLGHRPQGQLRSLPANLPCSDALWAPAGSVVAIWRRGFSASSGLAPLGSSCSTPQAAPALRRAVCVRVPQAALALVRSQRPELMGAQLQAAPQPSGTVLVFPGSAAQARPVGQASQRELQALADQLALALGPGARVHAVSGAEVCLTAWRDLDLPGAALLARSIARQLRLPLAVAVADSPSQALDIAGSLGGDQLLFLFPPAAASKPAAASRDARPVPPLAAVQPSSPSSRASFPAPPALVPSPVPSWPARPGSARRGPAQPMSVQLGLFEAA